MGKITDAEITIIKDVARKYEAAEICYSTAVSFYDDLVAAFRSAQIDGAEAKAMCAIIAGSAARGRSPWT